MVTFFIFVFKLDKMLRLIRTEEQHEDTLARIYELMQLDLQPDSEESDEMEILSMLVKKYENEHYPVPDRHLLKP